MRLLYGLANWKLLIPLYIAVVYFTAVIFPDYQTQINTIANADLISLDARLTYHKEDVFTLFTKMKEEGRGVYYFVSSRVDLIYPLLYGSFFILLLSRLLKNIIRPKSKWRFAVLLPVLSVTFDYLENIAIQNLLTTYPDITESQVTCASWMTQLKWVFLLSVLLLVCVLVIVAIKNKFNVTIKQAA